MRRRHAANVSVTPPGQKAKYRSISASADAERSGRPWGRATGQVSVESGRELPVLFEARGEPKPPLRLVDLRTVVDPSRPLGSSFSRLQNGHQRCAATAMLRR